MKTSDDESYFSRRDIDYYEIKLSNLEYETHVRLEQFEIIEKIKNSIVMCKREEFVEICQKLMDCD